MKNVTQEKMLKKSEKNYRNLLKRWVPDNLKKIIKSIFLKSRIMPKACSLFMTYRCNFKCLGCRRSVLNVNNSKEMELDTVKKLLLLYPTIKSFSIAGFGEPTLCEEFIGIVEFLKKEEKKINIITNGTSVKEILKLTCQVDQISVSLYGYDIDSYRLYTRVNAYKLVIENFLRLGQQFNNVGLSYILTRENYRDLDKLMPLCDKLKPDFLHLINYLAYDFANSEERQKIITVDDKEIINYIDEICKSRDYVKIKPVCIDFKNPKFNCSSYDSRINLDGNGNIGGCMRQIPPDSSFGNIFNERDPFNSLEMKKLRKIQHAMSKTRKTPHKECNYCFGNWYPK